MGHPFAITRKLLAPLERKVTKASFVPFPVRLLILSIYHPTRSQPDSFQPSALIHSVPIDPGAISSAHYMHEVESGRRFMCTKSSPSSVTEIFALPSVGNFE